VSERDEILFMCGGSGKVTEAAMVELMDFSRHLKAHPRGTVADSCRFCAQRAARPTLTETSRDGE